MSLEMIVEGAAFLTEFVGTSVLKTNITAYFFAFGISLINEMDPYDKSSTDNGPNKIYKGYTDLVGKGIHFVSKFSEPTAKILDIGAYILTAPGASQACRHSNFLIYGDMKGDVRRR